jgi:hypothetical protein
VTQDWVGTLDVPIHATLVINPKPQALSRINASIQDATPSLYPSMVDIEIADVSLFPGALRRQRTRSP